MCPGSIKGWEGVRVGLAHICHAHIIVSLCVTCHVRCPALGVCAGHELQRPAHLHVRVWFVFSAMPFWPVHVLALSWAPSRCALAAAIARAPHPTVHVVLAMWAWLVAPVREATRRSEPGACSSLETSLHARMAPVMGTRWGSTAGDPTASLAPPSCLPPREG